LAQAVELALRRAAIREVTVPHTTNSVDGTRVYFEDDGGDGAPVVFHGGFLDPIEEVRESRIAMALPAEFR
jgi:hypothetical protein